DGDLAILARLSAALHEPAHELAFELRIGTHHGFQQRLDLGEAERGELLAERLQQRLHALEAIFALACEGARDHPRVARSDARILALGGSEIAVEHAPQ